MKGNEKDVRTIDKLINGKNNTYDERNMWLAPYIYCSQKGAIEKNMIYISFSSPIIISNINIWNYTKSPKRGVKEVEIYLDESLLYKVFLFHFFILLTKSFNRVLSGKPLPRLII